MQCTSPMRIKNPDRFKFKKPFENVGSEWLELPCGHCLCCRRERRMELTLLQCCEASLYDDNWFLTLTYRPLPDGSSPVSLDKRHLSAYLESMRHYCRYNLHKPFRFFACGEYGDLYARPHYHLSIFGLSADDLSLSVSDDVSLSARRFLDVGRLRYCHTASKDANGNYCWQSPVVAARWPYGNHQIYRACRETFQYVAGYASKKLYGDDAREFELTGRIRPYSVQSRPSIGYPWFDRYYQSLSQPCGDKLVNDTLSISGYEWKIPRIFDKWLRGRYMATRHGDQSARADDIKRLRQLSMLGYEPDRQDLMRINDFELYKATQIKNNNKHNEV